MYDDAVHYSSQNYEVAKGLPILIGVDTGLTPAAAFVQLTAMGQLVVFDELVTDDCSIQEFAFDKLRPYILNNYRGVDYEIVVDPENKRSQTDKKTAQDILRKAGLKVTLGKTQNPTERFEAVVYFLRRKDGFILTPNCPILREGFLSEYKYERVSSTVTGTKYKEKPEKNAHSHVHEALQYAALEYVGGKIYRRAVAQQQQFIGPASSVAGY
jgi:hypothetical protein